MSQLSNTEVQEYISELATRRRVVFITGCARSGTTLLQRCMATVSDPVWYGSEHPLSLLYKERDSGRDGAHFVVKRTAKCYTNFQYIPKQVKVLHIVRNPEAVLTSTMGDRPGYYVTPERWGAELDAFLALEEQHPSENFKVVRYEDLMSDPDELQREIGEHLGLDFDLPFTRHVERNDLDDRLARATGKKIKWSAVDPARTVKKRDEEQIANRMNEVRPILGSKLNAFCKRFDYGGIEF